MKKGILLSLALLLVAFRAFGAELRIISELAPPLNFTDDGTETGKPEGQAVAIVQEIQKRLGDHTPIRFMPWARGYSMALRLPDILLFSTTCTEGREGLFQWVGPVGSKQWVFLARKGSTLRLSSLEDAKKVRNIGAYPNDVREQFLRQQGFTNIDSADNPGMILRKMLAGRDDLWLADMDQYRELAQKSGVDQGALVPVLTVQKTQLYLAFSKATAGALVEKWREALESMQKDGTYAAILKTWAP